MQIKQKSLETLIIKTDSVDIYLDPEKFVEEAVNIYSSNVAKIESDLGTFIDSAGEYEMKNIFVNGEKIKNEDNYIYDISSENINIGFVGKCKSMTSINVDLFSEVDILIIGTETQNYLNAKDCNDLIQKISPKIAIVYGFDPKSNEVKSEIQGMQPIDKILKITKSDISSDDNIKIYYFENN